MEHNTLYPITNSFRSNTLLDGMWKFAFDHKRNGEKNGWQHELPGDKYLPVPASFNQFFFTEHERNYYGTFWYQHDFFVPTRSDEKRLFLRFDAVCARAQVFINGKATVEHEGGYLPFEVEITDLVQDDATNRVTLRCNNELSRDTLPAGVCFTTEKGTTIGRPFFDFFPFSGVLRSVHLISLPTQHIVDFSYNTTLDGSRIKFSYELRACGSHHYRVALLDTDNTELMVGEEISGEVTLPHAKLWSPQSPYLYRFCIKLFDGTEQCDEYVDEIGLRTVCIEGDRILLNNESIYLKGAGRHEDNRFSGRGFDVNVEVMDQELLTWLHGNSFRTSHYPYAEEAYRLADRAGFLLIDEAPAVGLRMSQGEFLGGMDGDFFSGEWITDLERNHIQQIRDMIQRDKNHPSVIAWSLMNEPETTGDKVSSYFSSVFEATQFEDPQQRPRSFTLPGDTLINDCKVMEFADFVMLNRYPGWYSKWGYPIEEALDELKEELDEYAADPHRKPVLLTEFGADAVEGLHNLPGAMWSEEYQSDLISSLVSLLDSYEFIRGEQVWNLTDFTTSPGTMRVGGNRKGIFTSDRTPKAAAFALRDRWSHLDEHFKANA